MVAEVKTIGAAWNIVCNESKKMVHYCNSVNSKHQLENTGLRENCDFFDLANTHKILVKDMKTGFIWLTSGSYNNFGNNFYLAKICSVNPNCFNNDYSAAWLVYKKENLKTGAFNFEGSIFYFMNERIF